MKSRDVKIGEEYLVGRKMRVRVDRRWVAENGALLGWYVVTLDSDVREFPVRSAELRGKRS